MSGSPAVIGFGVGGIGLDGEGGVDDGKTVVFDFDECLRAIGEDDGVGVFVAEGFEGFGVEVDGLEAAAFHEGLVALFFQVEDFLGQVIGAGSWHCEDWM